MIYAYKIILVSRLTNQIELFLYFASRAELVKLGSRA